MATRFRFSVNFSPENDADIIEALARSPDSRQDTIRKALMMYFNIRREESDTNDRNNKVLQ